MDYQSLRDAIGAATVLGSRAGGTLIAPETVRALACDAAIIPAVLGGAGEVLEQGRTVRLFTPGQLRSLWLRDRTCTFPGCDGPAHWADAHHLVHWVDGGRTDLANAALLYRRHHRVVHRDRLAGAVIGGRVRWNLTPGSYRPGAPRPGPAARPPGRPGA